MPDDRRALLGTQSHRRSLLGRILGGVGILLHCTVVAFLFLTSGLIAPWYGLLVLFAAWVALLGLGVRWIRCDTPALAFAVPFLAVGTWVAVITIGGSVFGWTA